MRHDDDGSGGVDRRQFLRVAFAGTVGGFALRSGFSGEGINGTGAAVQPTPDAALQELVAGNRRYVANGLTLTASTLKALRASTAIKQKPFAAVLACADSRVPVELIFDQSIGTIFDARIAGNIVTPEITASLEYAVAELGVRALLVLGHSGCGAVTAAMKMENAPGQISALYPHIRPAIDQSTGNLDRAIEINARMQAELLASSSTVIRQAVASRTLKVASGVYDLASGMVKMS